MFEIKCLDLQLVSLLLKLAMLMIASHVSLTCEHVFSEIEVSHLPHNHFIGHKKLSCHVAVF